MSTVTAAATARASATSGTGETYVRPHLTKTRIAYRVVSTCTLAFVVVAAALAISYLVGMRYYVVVSGSMTPTMPTGSLCVVREPYPYDGVGVGDIIAFRTESGDITTHRVSAVTSRGLVTKGDANEDVDATPVTRVGYAGRVLWHAPGLGYVVEMLLSPVGIGVIVAAVLALLVAELALKRAADVEDAVDAEAERRDAEVAAEGDVVARAAANAVRATLDEYLAAANDAAAAEDAQRPGQPTGNATDWHEGGEAGA